MMDPEGDTRGMELDETDIAILAEMEESTEKNLKELSDQLDLSKSAIHYRMKKLKENGVVRRIAAEVNPHALGLDMVLFTDVMVSHESGYAEEIGEEITDIPGVSRVYYMMGDVDFMVVSRVQNHDQMHALIDDLVKIDGVNSTSSRFVIQEIKDDSQVVSNMSDEMTDHVLD